MHGTAVRHNARVGLALVRVGDRQHEGSGDVPGSRFMCQSPPLAFVPGAVGFGLGGLGALWGQACASPRP